LTQTRLQPLAVAPSLSSAPVGIARAPRFNRGLNLPRSGK